MPPPAPVKPRLRGALFALPAVLFASWLAAAADDFAAPRAADGGTPSTFDYLVLASMADSPQLHAMAGFLSSAGQRTELAPSQQQALKAADWRR